MSLLNKASDGLPNVLLALYRYLLAEGPTPVAKVLAVCAPDVVCDPKQARYTLNTWVEFGLFTRDSDDRVRVAKRLPEARLWAELRAVVLHPENNEPFWGQDGEERARAADFTRGLAWCLAMDPWRLHQCDGAKGVERLALDTLPAGVKVFQNDTRWPGFKAWAPVLGFGWLAGFPKKGALVIDPTPAVRDELPGVFAGAGELTQNVFLERLRDRLPVLDGGTYRRDVEQAIDRRAWTPPPPGAVSASLSLALLRLKNEGRIDFADRADAPTGRARLLGRGGKEVAAVTHVVHLGGRP
jgi:hypothetical protein